MTNTVGHRTPCFLPIGFDDEKNEEIRQWVERRKASDSDPCV